MVKILKSIYDLLFSRPVKIDPEKMLRSKRRYEELAREQTKEKLTQKEKKL